MTGYRDLLPVIVERENAVLPEGFDQWGLKSVQPDLKTRGGYQWPLPGGVAVADNVVESNTDACPVRKGDGLCVAKTWDGMASGGFPARTLLLVATRSSDVLGANRDKSRHREVAVVAVVDGQRLLREAGKGADLQGANLRRADLLGANLRSADLRGADLRDASLQGADLLGADLLDADLRRADLRGADLRGAGLRSADLRSAYLQGAIGVPSYVRLDQYGVAV